MNNNSSEQDAGVAFYILKASKFTYNEYQKCYINIEGLEIYDLKVHAENNHIKVIEWVNFEETYHDWVLILNKDIKNSNKTELNSSNQKTPILHEFTSRTPEAQKIPGGFSVKKYPINLLNIGWTHTITVLDNALKYNKYFKNKYLMFIQKIINYISTLKKKHYLMIIFVFQIFPQLFLIILLIIDVFYFNKLEIFYKIILIGLLLLIFKYFNYNFNDIKEYYIKELENTYENIFLSDKSAPYLKEDSDDWELNENNKYHNQEIPVREYLEFKIKQTLSGKPEVSYSKTPFSYEHIYEDYKKNNNIPKEVSLKKADHQVLDNKYYILSKNVIQAGVIHENFSHFQNEKIILYFRLLIFITYFTCWFYVLILSYYNNPIELEMFKYFIQKLMYYISRMDNPFSS